MNRTLKDLTESDIGSRVRIPYTNIEGTLDDYDKDYGDDVKIVIDGANYYLPPGFLVLEAMDFGEYDPPVLLGVVDPWSPL